MPSKIDLATRLGTSSNEVEQRGCIDAAAPKFGCKGGPKDLGCLCSNLPKIQAEATGCVAKCAGADVGALLTQANEVCGCVAGKRKF